MRKVPENNSLEKEIRKLLELCKKDEKDNGEKRNYFNAPITEEEMINWEERNRAKIPESYKEWLRFSGKCRIAGNTATFWGPNEFHSEYVPEGLVATVYKGNIIKNLIMDCQSYTKYRPNETTGGIFVSWRRKEELPTGA